MTSAKSAALRPLPSQQTSVGTPEVDDDPFDPTHHFPDSGEIFERLQRLAAGELENLLTPRSTENLRIFDLAETDQIRAQAVWTNRVTGPAWE